MHRLTNDNADPGRAPSKIPLFPGAVAILFAVLVSNQDEIIAAIFGLAGIGWLLTVSLLNPWRQQNYIDRRTAYENRLQREKGNSRPTVISSYPTYVAVQVKEQMLKIGHSSIPFSRIEGSSLLLKKNPDSDKAKAYMSGNLWGGHSMGVYSALKAEEQPKTIPVGVEIYLKPFSNISGVQIAANGGRTPDYTLDLSPEEAVRLHDVITEIVKSR